MLKFYDEGHIYELDGIIIPSVSEILRFLSREMYDDINKFVLDHAAERGTAVHSATQQIDETGECDIEPSYAGYVESYVRFLREHDVCWDLIERPLADACRGYAGTLDRRGWVDGKYCTVDLKTNGVVKKTLVKAQLNGYEGLCIANGLMPSEQLKCLQLASDGRYRFYDVAKDATEFDCCLNLHKALKKKHGRMKIE